MTKNSNHKPNYNEMYAFENSRGEESYLPEQYKGYTDSFYENDGDSNAGSFLVGAIVGGVIGAATALFLAPKTGKEMREDFSTQAVQLKEKGIEISAVAKDKATEFSSVAKDKATEFSSVAKDKATEFSSVAKEKTDEVTKSIQEQSGQIVDKVKTMTSKTSVPMDDGTASSEGEEATEYIEEKAEESKEDTNVAEAVKDAVKDAVSKDK